MSMEIIKRRPLIIGIAIIFAIYIISDMIAGVSLLLPSFLLAGIAVGFMVKEDLKTSAINGAVLGLISSIIVNLILIGMIYLQGYGDYIVSIILTYLIYIVMEIVVAAVGGVLGSLIRSESMPQEVKPEN
jgi:hypothetical protein